MKKEEEKFIMKQQRRRRNTTNKAPIIITLTIFGIILYYLIVAITYTGKFLPNTFVNGVDVSGEPINKVKNVVANRKSGDTLIVTGQYGEKLELNIDEYVEYTAKNLEKVSKQNIMSWPFAKFKRKNIEVDYDVKLKEGLIENVIDMSNFIKGKQIEEPVNATLEVKDGEVIITDDKPGNAIDKTKLKEAIIKGIQDNSLVVEFTDYPKAEVTTESLQKQKEYLEEKMNHTIDIDVRGKKYTLNIKTLYPTEELSKEKLQEFIANMANETDTINKERKFKDVNGEERTIQSGTFGWKMDRVKTFENLYNNIINTKYDSFTPEYAVQAVGDDEIGNTYIEIDLSKQHLWVFVDGVQTLDSNLVSGQVPKAFTPVGIHSIKGKQKGRTLKGKNRITQKEYASYVDYWMPIDWQGVGMHDASWQYGDFNPNKYLTGHGSNGCINLPFSTAEYIFNNFPVGTPVVIYESSTNYSKNFIP